MIQAMVDITIRGEIPNLTLLLRDLDPHLSALPESTTTLRAEPADPTSLHSAEWGELVIAFGVSLAAGATWDAIKLAIAAARRRGELEVELPDDQRHSDEGHAGEPGA